MVGIRLLAAFLKSAGGAFAKLGREDGAHHAEEGSPRSSPGPRGAAWSYGACLTLRGPEEGSRARRTDERVVMSAQVYIVV